MNMNATTIKTDDLNKSRDRNIERKGSHTDYLSESGRDELQAIAFDGRTVDAPSFFYAIDAAEVAADWIASQRGEHNAVWATGAVEYAARAIYLAVGGELWRGEPAEGGERALHAIRLAVRDALEQIGGVQ
jgi:hypothetical protein